jgi:quercetin dioxygenase-like cupin family protein
MQLTAFPFEITDFSLVAPEVHTGTTGHAEWRTLYRNDIRIRLVTYSPGYLADHWCNKGHIIYCAEGSMTTELHDGSKHTLVKGCMYSVGDDADAHRSFSEEGCILFIVD